MNTRLDKKDEQSRFVMLKNQLTRGSTFYDTFDDQPGKIKITQSYSNLRNNAALTKHTDDLTVLHYQNYMLSGAKKTGAGGTIDSDIASVFQRTLSGTDGTNESPERSPHGSKPVTAHMYS